MRITLNKEVAIRYVLKIYIEFKILRGLLKDNNKIFVSSRKTLKKFIAQPKNTKITVNFLKLGVFICHTT